MIVAISRQTCCSVLFSMDRARFTLDVTNINRVMPYSCIVVLYFIDLLRKAKIYIYKNYNN